MMTNLFSSFDPLSSILGLSLNWTSTGLGLLFIPYVFWAMPSRWSILWSSLTKTLHQEFKILLGPMSSSGTLLFASLFSLIVFNNFLGLLPYIFTSTSHLAMTLALALPLWISFMIFGWVNHTQHMFAHLVPLGTPGALMPFMVLIETVSNVIRPGTLAVRLAANMIAGHLLLTLLGNTGPSLSLSLLSVLVMSQTLLLLLESAVAIIQSYVFAVLSSLYASEVN
uniref:ATP synthase F0 subunit 6 n=1 Tax=Caridina pseudogracilirostris TaxID=1042303 RepID=UPI0025520BD1|nr:ATP synthase F0 subunit 6 [Caridina pseudogracilirostris]WGU19665.1 ATP synthase F0 subunit 6 [Caridina pseudogracilirostris]